MSTPPPQNPFGQQPQPGQNPFGQQPQPGQPQPGQNPYGQPGMPPTGGMPQPGGYPGAPAPQGGKAKKLLRFIVPIAVLSIAVGSYFFNKTDAEKVNAGDCISVKGFSEVEVKQIDCSDSEATHKVLKKVEGDTSRAACENVSGVTQQVYTKESSKDFSLCLGDVDN